MMLATLGCRAFLGDGCQLPFLNLWLLYHIFQVAALHTTLILPRHVLA